MKKKIIILVCVLAALSAAVAGLVIRNRKQEAESGSDSSSSRILKYLWEYDEEEIASITLETSKETITLLPGEYDHMDDLTWYIEGHKDWTLDDSVYSHIVQMGEMLPAYLLIEEDVTDTSRLSEFGLSPAQSTVTVNLKDGTARSCKIGILSSDKDYTFCQVDGDSNVYAINSMYNEYSSYTAESLRSQQITAIDADATLMYLFVQKKGNRPVEIVRDEERQLNDSTTESGGYYTTDLVFKQPYTNPHVEVNGDLESQYFYYLSAPTVVETVEVDCQDMSQYGLTDEDPEYHEIITTRTGDTEEDYQYNTTDYLFGYTYGDGQYVYFREKGSTLVLGVEAGSLLTRYWSPFSYTNKLLYINSVYNIESGSFIWGTRTYNFAVKRSEATDSSDERVYACRINDVLIDEDLYHDFYLSIISIAPSYEIDDTEPAYQKDDMISYTFRYWDGTSETFTLYRLDDYYYVTKIQDNTWFAISVESINTLTEELDKVDAALSENANAY